MTTEATGSWELASLYLGCLHALGQNRDDGGQHALPHLAHQLPQAPPCRLPPLLPWTTSFI